MSKDATPVAESVEQIDALTALNLAMTWIRNWDVPFADDEEWLGDKALIEAAIEASRVSVTEAHPSLELCVQFSDDGQHIRKWSRLPFDGGVCLYSHPLPATAYEAGRAEGVRAASSVADKVRGGWVNGDATTPYGQAYQAGALDAATAIRALSKEPTK